MRAAAAYTLIVIALGSTTALADDPASEAASTENNATQTIAPAPAASLLDEWQIETFDLLETGSYSSNYVSSLDDDFLLKSSVVTPTGRYRSLSLVTFAEMGKARLFLGLNSEGLLGFHFNALPKLGRDTNVEVVRMPYLETKTTEQSSETGLTRSSRRAR